MVPPTPYVAMTPREPVCPPKLQRAKAGSKHVPLGVKSRHRKLFVAALSRPTDGSINKIRRSGTVNPFTVLKKI